MWPNVDYSSKDNYIEVKAFFKMFYDKMWHIDLREPTLAELGVLRIRKWSAATLNPTVYEP